MTMWAPRNVDGYRSTSTLHSLRTYLLVVALVAISQVALAAEPAWIALGSLTRSDGIGATALAQSNSLYIDFANLAEPSAVSPMAEPNLSGDNANHDADRVSSVPSIQTSRESRPDSDNALYYKNKLDVSLEGGFLPINVPFMFDFLVGDAYITEKVHYSMVPIFASIDWQTSRIDGPLFLRGTWDATFGGTAAAVSRGPESKFFGYHMGIRRNFLQRRWKVVPYLDGRVGVGHIDARGPQGVWGAQGQDLVFSLNISSGLRYQLSKHYSMSLAAGYMHISNMYLSLPRYANNGINVTGLMLGVHYRIPTREERTRAR